MTKTWTNTLTWDFDTWLLNEGDNFDLVYSLGSDALEEAEGDHKKAVKIYVEKIKAMVASAKPDTSLFWGYVIDEGLKKIDYKQIAETLLADLEQTEEEG